MTSREEEREANRAAYPEFAEFVDHLRLRFGGCRIRWMQLPDGTERGKRGGPGVIASIPYRPDVEVVSRSGPGKRAEKEGIMAMKGKKGKGGGGKKC